MAFIKTLKDFLTKNTIYPTTKTNAVYDDTVGRLDTFLHNTLGVEEVDNVEEETAELRDADTLGGRYTAEDLDAMPHSTAIEDYANVEPPMNDADRLGGRYTAEDVYAMAKRIVELESESENLNNSLVWKEIGIASATQSLKLPSDFNELEIALRTNGTNHTGIIRVSKASLSWLQKGLISNCVWYQTASDSVSYRIQIVNNSISLSAVRVGGVESSDTTSIRVLYR